MALEFFTYYRVSTTRQGVSGLGLDAQKVAAQSFLKGSSGVLLGEYTEVESGRKADRPKLKEALKACRLRGATLLIAKLDRLARNVHFISGLLETDVKFVAIDMPNADRFMLHVYAAMAEEEARRISERTKSALRSAKARGVKLGINGKVLAQQNILAADQFARQIGPQIEQLQNTDGLSFRGIAKSLNNQAIRTANGASWHPTSVYRVHNRFKALMYSQPLERGQVENVCSR